MYEPFIRTPTRNLGPSEISNSPTCHAQAIVVSATLVIPTLAISGLRQLPLGSAPQ